MCCVVATKRTSWSFSKTSSNSQHGERVFDAHGSAFRVVARRVGGETRPQKSIDAFLFVAQGGVLVWFVTGTLTAADDNQIEMQFTTDGDNAKGNDGVVNVFPFPFQMKRVQW
jgi:hypothetical protein